MTNGGFSGMTDKGADADGLASAILAGGCFWCTEAVFGRLRGVHAVEPGYIGGASAATANYEDVCSGLSGHAEAVRIRFDPAQIGFEALLAVFFATHDPTQLDRQGHDVGNQYRSAIFYLDSAQRAAALQMLTALEGSFAAPLVTAVVPAGEFHPAEAYHRDYYRRHPQQAYCSYVIAPKLVGLQAKFPHLTILEE